MRLIFGKDRSLDELDVTGYRATPDKWATLVKKFLGEIRLKLTFHSKNARCDPVNFNTLKLFSISCLNLEVSYFKLG